MEILDNGVLSIAVKEHGAELCSIKYKGREYLWQADGEFWARHSPVLFPIVGSVWNKEFRSHGRIFPMGQHGFARDTDFELISRTDCELWYRLESSEATLEKYPYEFVLKIGYRIVNQSIEVLWRVENPSNKTMYFQIGAHPAFHWPMLSSEAIAEGTIAMKSELSKNSDRGYFKFGLTPGTSPVLPRSLFGGGGCYDTSSSKVPDELDRESMISLDTSTFDNDALVYEDSLVNKVSLCDASRKPYLSLEFDAPVVGLWSPPGKNAPFVCIEPWYGRADDCGYDGPYEKKPWMNSLAPGAVFSGGYTITLD